MQCEAIIHHVQSYLIVQNLLILNSSIDKWKITMLVYFKYFLL